MSISLIACIDKANGIGNKGSLLTKPPLDFKYFKELTMNNYCVFGRSTFDEIGKPLPNRHNIVLTKNTKHEYHPDVNVYPSVNDILHDYYEYAEKQINLFICGGEKVYSDFLLHADYIYLTIVDHKFKADRHFPKFSLNEWQPVETIKNEATEGYPYDYYFVKYQRKQN
jgi:dihydrofolate reductase